MAKAKPLPKMPKAGKGGKSKVSIDKDMGNKEDSTNLGPAPAPKPHAREMKTGEKDRLAKGRQLVASFIVQRDGLDPEIAAQVVEGMEPEEINSLIAEANTAVIERTRGTQAAPETTSAGTPENVPATEAQAGAAIPAPPAVDFLSVPLLAADEDFAPLALGIPELAMAKNKAEEMLKKAKAIVVSKARAANVLKLTVADWKVSVFEGGSSHIDSLMLIENGVDPAIIRKCTKKTRYWDVKVSPPGAPKEASGE